MFKRVSWLLAAGLLAACAGGAPDTAVVGQPAPEFAEASVAGGQVSLSDFEGQAVLLYFSMADG